MASRKEYVAYVMEQLSSLQGVSTRPMMGEYVLYYRDKAVGGIYDDRLLLKPVPSALALMPQAVYEIPYEGAKPMLLADVDDSALVCSVLTAMYDELPAPKPKKPCAPKKQNKKEAAQ